MSRARIRLSVVTVLIAGSVWLWAGDFGGPVDAPVPVVEASEQTPWQETDLWLAPVSEPLAPSDIARGVELLASQPADALPLLAPSLGDPVLGPYARLYVGRAHLTLGDHDRAATAARHIIDEPPSVPLHESAWWLLAEALEGAETWGAAVEAWQGLTELPSRTPATAHLRLAQAAERAGQPAVARDAYARIYYEWPATVEADAATAALAKDPLRQGPDTFRLELERADKLYAARRFAEASRAYDALHTRASGEQRVLIELRQAQCDVQLQRFARGLERLTAYLARHSHAAGRVDAELFTLTALRGLRRADYPTRVARFVRDHPDSPFAESALNDLATHYILANDDARAAQVFTDMYARFPRGAFADRAAWRAGWLAYRQRNHRETIRLFESAATNMRRADYRPSWLYWTARSYEALRQPSTARLWYLRAMADYRNSYYGREAARALSALPGGSWTDADMAAERDPSRAIVAGEPPPHADRIQRLLSAGLWDDAIAELRQVQATSGTSPVIEATIAFALNRKGELRPGITAMRRAYPQFMSDGGERLPERMLKVIFPVAYRDLIHQYADDRRLDRYLVTALVAQESTFQADVRSSANAIGLMQLLPSTGRQYAARTRVTPFSTARLTEPDVNVRLGTAYLADLFARFKDVAPALAAYNAGEGRVVRWQAERPGIPRDEFIDDIPFPETQNYVKRIIGTTEDYRLLYGSSVASNAGQTTR